MSDKVWGDYPVYYRQPIRVSNKHVAYGSTCGCER